ncbi:MAG: PilZ domain-containing protein, partial [Polyangiales bacterium]
MPQLEGRRSERVAYRAPVELLAFADGDEIPRRVIARTLDLGAGGMRLRAPVQMRVGAQVTCCVDLDGQPTALPGRVAWMHRGGSVRYGDGHGMGICFEALGHEESALLQQVVERAGERSRVVELRFPGLATPVQARAREREGGLRLSAKLPILARGAELAFRLDEDGPWLRARIGAAALREENAERRLEIDVDLLEP